MKKVFISTAIPYVNAKPHLGFAFEIVLTDALARFYRLDNNETFFLTGTDENSLKNVLAAEEVGMETSDFVDQNAAEFFKLKEVLNLSFDDFIRTTEQRHVDGARELWALCAKDIYKKKYKGLYCVGCEEFKTEKDLINGRCPEHPNNDLQQVEEENYFFRLSNYQKKLKELIESDKLKIIPETRKNEVLSFINQGLEDFSISRSRERARGWGVPVPTDESQIMYVWFDALSNYINGYNWKNWQKADKLIHVIGKGVIRFHAIYWPAMLLSAGLRLPDEIFTHGYITVENQKISKSLGNVIHPKTVADVYGIEPLRYYLIREISSFEDGDYSEDKFKNSYNANLANGLGNLVSRVMKMAVDYKVEYKLEKVNLPKEYIEAFGNFNLKKAADFVWGKIGELDKYIQETTPFKTIKTDETKAASDVAHLVLGLWEISHLLKPIMPETAEKIIELVENKKTPEKPLFLRK